MATANATAFIRKILLSLDDSEFDTFNHLLKSFQKMQYKQTLSLFLEYCQPLEKTRVIKWHLYRHIRTICAVFPHYCLYAFRCMMEELTTERANHIADCKAPDCLVGDCNDKCRPYEDGWFLTCSSYHTYRIVKRRLSLFLLSTSKNPVMVCSICMKEMVEIPKIHEDEPSVYKCVDQHVNIKSATKT